MISLLICEGTSDAILYGYYLIKKFDWKFVEKNNRPKFLTNINLKENQSYDIYKKDGRFLVIVSAGGVSRYKEIWNNFKFFNSLQSESQRINKIVMIRDRDVCSDEEVLKYFQDIIKEKEVILNEINKYSIVNDFDESVAISIIPLVIPDDKAGALETAILDSLSSSEVYKIIVKESNMFVVGTKEKVKNLDREILKENRMLLKATLSSFFSIISPMRIFEKIDKILLDYKWHEDRRIGNILGKMEFL